MQISSDSDEASSSPENGKFSISVCIHLCENCNWLWRITCDSTNNNISNCVLRDLVQRLYRSILYILYFQDVIQFRGACADRCTPHIIICTCLIPNSDKIRHYCLNFGFHSADFHETHIHAVNFWNVYQFVLSVAEKKN